ncbi:Gfo/Idh/MocA family protein [Ferruginibacter albus]|uniref:Gfo/Idh/MocA family protein n=1 Tax=Ferruginibacter albus TaxID=2875540 RepID=UPI001CC808C7|nr:Gfo/Idh/MocA family oxidoreductase [Ferruginibacter albus]UAY51849.1 Gfo/Idh/MocA family oxidoreductase [Ferruginibacter albus]
MFSRRKFIATAGTTLAGSLLLKPSLVNAAEFFNGTKKRYAMVGTGDRGTSMWGKDVMDAYPDLVEFVGLCDKNKGRVEYAKKYMGVSCPTFTDFDEMMKTTKPDILIVTTMCSTHDQFIIRGMELGADIITEKPMTTDETKCQAILDAEKRTGKKVTVTFNYRYSPHRAKIWELLRAGAIGKMTSVDFHWYLDIHHGADYFRRWHRLRENSGTLLVHKATHHFDLLNWWIDSDPVEVFGFGDLEFYGKNHSFRSTNCRPCTYKDQCKFYFDVSKKQRYVDLYVNNEQYDGYLRDGCVWKEDINIFDKMNASIKYANNVEVSYSLTTYSPYEGYRIAFNGTEGRLEAWIKESNPPEEQDYDEIMITKNFQKPEFIRVPKGGGGHAGGDKLLKDKVFGVDKSDALRQTAGTRDGALSCLIGIATRKSIDSGKPVRIEDLTTIKPQEKKM